jgi:hypothetical protein
MTESPSDARAHLRIRVGLLAVAALLRVAYALDAPRLPFVAAPLFDSAVYDRQAQAILAGDFGNATLLAFGPLTGWFLAATGTLAVPLQLMMGLATAALVERLARSLAGARAGLAALALYVAYGLPLFYETKWMSETLGLFFLTASLVVGAAGDAPVSEPAAAPRSPRDVALRHLFAGVLLGFATLARASLVVVLPFALVAPLVATAPRAAEFRRGLLRAGALGLGLALVLGANGAWNLRHAGRFVPVILVSDTAARASSHDWRGSLEVFGRGGEPPSAWDVVRQAEVSLGRRARPPAPTAGVREAPGSAHGIDLVGVARGAPRKLLALFGDIETSFDYGYYGERLEIRALGWLPGSMGTNFLLALLGALLLARRGDWRRLVAIAPVPLGVALTFVLFHPSSRYRLPLVPVVVALAGVGAIALWDAVRSARGRRRVGVWLVAAALGLASLVFAYRQIGYELAEPSSWEVRVAEGDLARGNLGAAKRRLTRAWRASAEDSGTRRHIIALERAAGFQIER